MPVANHSIPLSRPDAQRCHICKCAKAAVQYDAHVESHEDEYGNTYTTTKPGVCWACPRCDVFVNSGAGSRATR